MATNPKIYIVEPATYPANDPGTDQNSYITDQANGQIITCIGSTTLLGRFNKIADRASNNARTATII